MSRTQQVAVVHYADTAATQVKAIQHACDGPCDLFPVKDVAQLQGVVQRLHAAGTSTYNAVVNLCTDEPSSMKGGLTPALAALFLERAALPYSGCRTTTLSYPLDVLLMMLSYAEIPLPPFAVIDSEDAARRAAERLRTPVLLRSACPLLGLQRDICDEQCNLEKTLKLALTERGKLVVWEISPSKKHAVRVLIMGEPLKGAAAVVPLECHSTQPSWAAKVDEVARRCGCAISRHVLYGCGVASLTLNALDGEPDRWCMEDISLNPPISTLLAQEGLWNLPGPSLSLTEVVASMVTEACRSHPMPTFEVRLHADSRKGYHLCAAKELSKGEIVFEDECRSFSIVTRPHVEQFWDDSLRTTFTEYAWPLDLDGHLYAIWEKDPQRWRPINHSCDPNLVFAAPHSLNVIAARHIAAGEDLSMDYATFCDGTMKPFQCLCGAECCRGLIKPDAASLAKYGENSWLRAVPPPVKPLFSSAT